MTRVLLGSLAGACTLFIGFASAFGLRIWMGFETHLNRELPPKIGLDEAQAKAEQAGGWLELYFDGIARLELTLFETPHGMFLAVLATCTLCFFFVITLAAWAASRYALVLRFAILVGVAKACTAAILLSIHPLLSLRQVPEGPRAQLNMVFELIGYGWVNVIAYGGAIAGAAVTAYVARRPRPSSRAGSFASTDAPG